jgi:hypothetical protein
MQMLAWARAFGKMRTFFEGGYLGLRALRFTPGFNIVGLTAVLYFKAIVGSDGSLALMVAPYEKETRSALRYYLTPHTQSEAEPNEHNPTAITSNVSFRNRTRAGDESRWPDASDAGWS